MRTSSGRKIRPYAAISKHLLIAGGALVMIYPLLWMLFSSFKLPENIFNDAGLWSERFTLDNYAKGWEGVARTSFAVFMKNSFIVSGLSIVGNIFACSLAAYAFSRLEFRFKNALFAAMLVTIMLPFHVVVVPQYIIFNELGWINTFLPLVVPKFLGTESFFIFLMVQFMRTLPRELDQAATVDGCGKVQIYWRVVLPLTLPAIITTIIFTFIWTWNDFFSHLLYLADIRKQTITLGLRLFLDSDSVSQWGPMLAMSVVSLVPVFIVFLFFQKYLVEGITAGGVKG